MPSAHPALATRRLLQVGAAFVIVYAAANHLTSLRGDIGHGVFEWERAIPFVEWTVLPYLSIFLLLPLSFFVCRDAAELHEHVRRLLVALGLAAVCYAAFPLGFHFERPQPQGPLAPLFGMLWTLDLPYNRAPSLHIVVLLLMWPRLVSVLAAAWQRGVAHAWLAAIGVSVLTTYQHHVIDIAGGMAVSTLFTLVLLPALLRFGEDGELRRIFALRWRRPALPTGARDLRCKRPLVRGKPGDRSHTGLPASASHTSAEPHRLPPPTHRGLENRMQW